MAVLDEDGSMQLHPRVELRAREELFSRVSDQMKALSAIARRTRGRGTIYCDAKLPGDDHPIAPVPGSLQTSSTTPFHGPCMPMWPSPRRLWPPSCSMCSCWGVGSTRVCFGECGGTNLPRGWRARGNQHSRARVGCP